MQSVRCFRIIQSLGFAAINCLLACLIMMTGCARSAEITVGTEPRPYNYEATTIQVVDIQVFRDGDQIEIVNHSAHGYTDFDLWLNERYVRYIAKLAPAQRLVVSLNQFVDEYQEAFRGGGWFAAYEPEPIVKAEIETDEGMIQIIPIPDRGER